jgi:hypothetical protein
MNVVYVCVSTKSDYYLEQTYASIVTLKKNMPEVFISLIIDDDTEQSLCDGREHIRDVCDKVIVRPFDQMVSRKVRSRILKTSMRNIVDGDFLYIDGDTFIFQDLSEIECSQYALAGVLDHHCKLSDNTQSHTHRLLKSKICADERFLSDETFFNSGVIWTKDTKENREFFLEWNRNYLKGVKDNVTQDQPSLALTNFEKDFPIKELDGSWNCQLEAGAGFFHDVKIFHYFASYFKQKSIDELIQKVREMKFSKDVRQYIEDGYDRIAFDFGPCTLTRGAEHRIQSTAMYRAIIVLFKKYRRVFKVFEKIALLGRGRGFYFRS